MKPPRFEYYDPRTLPEALELLRQLGAGAKLLAGGQSLVPVLNMRLSRPDALVDLNRIPDLGYIRAENGGVAVGAMARHRAVETSPVVAAACPLLHEAAGLIGHVQIRNRGTLGGSLAHADPAAELPAAAVALGAELVAESAAGGRRVIPAAEFFLGFFTTALAPDEMLVEVRWPQAPPGSGSAFVEMARRAGDFALCGVAAQVTLDAQGRLADVRLALTGVGPGPVAVDAAALTGAAPAAAAFARAADLARAAGDPESDVHGTAEYRRHLAGVLTRRALGLAAERARRLPQGGEA